MIHKKFYLKPNTEFGLDLKAGKYDHLLPNINFGLKEKMNARNNFDAFVSKANEIGHFVPSVDGVPLVKPEIENYKDHDDWEDDLVKFNIASMRCLFKGFEIIAGTYLVKDGRYYAYWEDESDSWLFYAEYSNIDDLTKFGLELSSTAIEEIFGKIN